MSFGITKTIPSKEGQASLNALYEIEGEFEFHMAGKPSKLNVGDYVSTSFQDPLHGRLKVIRIEGGAVNPNSGRPRSLIFVATPGERLVPPIAKQGHRGTRYTDGADWPTG